MLMLECKLLIRAPWRSRARWGLRPTVHQSFRLPHTHRGFSRTAPRKLNDSSKRGSFRPRLLAALRETKINWAPVPIGFGIAFLGLLQLYKVQHREEGHHGEDVDESIPKKRKRIRPSGPWTVQIMSYLPLKGVSRVWGWFNELEIPYYLRVPGFRLYAWVFGVNLSEASSADLHTYPNLASFFYRSLRPGVRPLCPDASALLSPADGKVLQFGLIEHGEVEQIKGMTYSLEALLGSSSPTLEGEPGDIHTLPEKHPGAGLRDTKADEEFANINGISYTLPTSRNGRQAKDASTAPRSSSEAEVRADLALGDGPRSWFFPTSKRETALYYVVIYLAPGDYHRFHSPTSWVVEKRRHFAGELYSVSPYLQRTLPGLFTLNERVVLLGRWRWGFFSFTPVGATNVGSIKINFDAELRTNSLTTDTEADRSAELAARSGRPYLGFAEATYAKASEILGGHALRRGEEMGGFQLGSSIVLVFEAPKGQRRSFDQGWEGGSTKGGWRWGIQQGQKVKYGEAIGWIGED